MPALDHQSLLSALKLEGQVTVFKNRKGSYEVSFRYGKRQYNRKLGTKRYALAKIEAAKAFASVVRAERDEVESRTLQGLYAEVAELKQMFRTVCAYLPFSNSSVPGPVPLPSAGKAPQEALLAFLEEKKKHVSVHHYNSLDVRCTSCVEFLGKLGIKDTAQINREHVIAWLDSKGELSHRSWNNYAADALNFINYCRINKWRAEKIELSKRKVRAGIPQVISPDTARDLMTYLEEERPEYVAFYAIALFAGVRSDKLSSELTRLADAVQRDGWEKYQKDGYVWIPTPKAEAAPRRIKLFPNLAAWLKAYPNLKSSTDEVHRALVRRFKLPPNSLRHTAISSFVCSGAGSLTEAGLYFGNSECIIRKHYLNLVSPEVAKQLYEIMPSAQIDAGK